MLATLPTDVLRSIISSCMASSGPFPAITDCRLLPLEVEECLEAGLAGTCIPSRSLNSRLDRRSSTLSVLFTSCATELLRPGTLAGQEHPSSFLRHPPTDRACLITLLLASPTRPASRTDAHYSCCSLSIRHVAYRKGRALGKGNERETGNGAQLIRNESACG